MKSVTISIEDLMVVLEALKENGSTEIMLFEYNGAPAMSDASEPDNIISFQTESANGEVEDETRH